jgi:hypothetical protein
MIFETSWTSESTIICRSCVERLSNSNVDPVPLAFCLGGPTSKDIASSSSCAMVARGVMITQIWRYLPHKFLPHWCQRRRPVPRLSSLTYRTVISRGVTKRERSGRDAGIIGGVRPMRYVRTKRAPLRGYHRLSSTLINAVPY